MESLIFDVDGTLWDAVALVAEGWNDGLQSMGFAPHCTEQSIRPLFGKTMTEIAQVVVPGVPQEQAMEVMDRCMDGEMARLWVMDLAHPIVQGLEDHFDLPIEETYGEHFDIPKPDDLIFVSWIPGGEVFRSGCCWHRGKGKVFYFRPGHEAFPIYYQPEIQQVIVNAVKWATPIDFPPVTYGNPPAIMEVHGKLEHSIQGLHQPK